MAADLRSLAHKHWPYVGTAHEWRGFAERVERRLTAAEEAALWKSLIASGKHQYFAETVYQKQSFGPELK